jgi:hypothetical protein
MAPGLRFAAGDDESDLHRVPDGLVLMHQLLEPREGRQDMAWRRQPQDSENDQTVGKSEANQTHRGRRVVFSPGGSMADGPIAGQLTLAF